MSIGSNKITPEFKSLLKKIRLSQILDTLPERLITASEAKMSHLDFLEMIISDESIRREQNSTLKRSKQAHLDQSMCAELWDSSAAISFDRSIFDELLTLRFLEQHHNVIIMGPVGVGKTFLATSLGHIATRRKFRVHFERADKLFKRLKIARLTQNHEAQLSRLIKVELLIIDDFALSQMDREETTDFYELVVERHKKGSMIITSNRQPNEMLELMTDPLLAQSAIDRVQNASYEVVIEGESYRKRERPKAQIESQKTASN